MANTDASRVWVQEGAFTYTETALDFVLREIDTRISGANCFIDITRTAGTITKFEYFKEVGRINLMVERVVNYTAGKISGFTDTYFNADTSNDSQVIGTFTRDLNGNITACDSPFSTTEDTKL